VNIKSLKIISLFSLLLLFLNGCASNTLSKKKKGFKHDTPLIKEDIKKSGQIEIEKTVKMGGNAGSKLKAFGKGLVTTQTGEAVAEGLQETITQTGIMLQEAEYELAKRSRDMYKQKVEPEPEADDKKEDKPNLDIGE